MVKAYLNYLVFDKDYNPDMSKSGAIPVAIKAAEDGSNVPHQELSTTINITEPGFVYIYLSNENPVPYDVFFDDFKVEHIQSPIVQADDYYPFGLTFNSYKRENRIGNKFLFNGVELDSKTKNYETSFRGYDPSLGRFMQIDPLADVIPGISTYHFGYNNPIKYADPLGLIGEQDMWGRDKFDDNGAFIPSIDRPGGPLCSGCGDLSKGRWEAVETPVFALDYSTHVDTDGNGSYDYNNYSYTLSSETNYRWVFDDFNKYSSPGRNGEVLHAGIGQYKDVLNIAAYLAGTSTTVNELYRGYKFLNAFMADPKRSLNSAFPGRFNGLSTNTLNKLADYRVAKAVARGLSKPLLGAGIVLTGVDIYQNDFSASSIAWGAADTGIAIAAIAVSGPAAPFVAIGAALYFTGRFAYGVYEAYNEGN